jgi:hypothetical protein
MIVRELDINNDWTFGKGLNSYLQEMEAIRQCIQTRLLSWVGDCYFALNDGVDYNNFLDIGTKILLDGDIKREILQSYGVVKINSFNSNIDNNRNYSATINLTTIYGDLNIGV